MHHKVAYRAKLDGTLDGKTVSYSCEMLPHLTTFGAHAAVTVALVLGR